MTDHEQKVQDLMDSGVTDHEACLQVTQKVSLSTGTETTGSGMEGRVLYCRDNIDDEARTAFRERTAVVSGENGSKLVILYLGRANNSFNLLFRPFHISISDRNDAMSTPYFDAQCGKAFQTTSEPTY